MKRILTLCLSAALLGGMTAEARTLKEVRAGVKEWKTIRSDRNKSAGEKQQQSPFKKAPDGSVKLFKKASAQKNPLVQGKKAPSRITAGGSEVYGYQTYSDNQDICPPGMYEIQPQGASMLWGDEFYNVYGIRLTNGYMMDGLLQGNAVLRQGNSIGTMLKYSIDIESGEIIEVTDVTDGPYYEHLTYNPNDGYLYGFGYNWDYDDGVNYLFMKCPADNFLDATVISEVSEFRGAQSISFNFDENAVYAVTTDSDFVRIDLDGTITNVMHIDYDYSALYLGGLVYAPSEGIYYWNLSSDVAGYMATINGSAKTFNVYEQLEYGNQFLFLVSADEPVDPSAPVKPTIKSTAFMCGSTSGWNIYTMPTEMGDGSPIRGEMKAFATLDGQPYGPADGYSVKPGQNLRVLYSKLSNETHRFGLYVVVDGNSSREASNSVYIGFDTPTAPEGIQLTDSRVTWQPVATGVNGGYVAFAEMEYEVYVNGELQGRTSDTKLNVTLPQDKEMAVYKAEVVAICKGKTSEPGVSNGIIAGKPFSIPFTIEPTEDQASLCSLEDSDGDEKVWGYNPEYAAFQIGYNGYDNVDDWLFLPPFTVTDANKYYTVDFEAAILSSSYPDEALEIYVGTAPDSKSMTIEACEPFTPVSEAPSFDKSDGIFKVPAPGTYYVGIHCVSQPDQLGMAVRNISVTDNNITVDSPSKVFNLEVEPADEGALKATVSFNFPRTTLGKNNLPENAELVATINAATVTTVKGAPGDRVSVEVETLQGNNNISVAVSYGSLNGPSEKISVYTGVVIPNYPVITKAEVSADMKSLTLEWEPVTTGVNDGYVDPSDITYSIFSIETVWFFQIPVEIENIGSATSYTLEISPEQAMGLYEFGVAAVNAAGYSTIPTTTAYIGTPYTLPMVENFESESGLDLDPWVIYTLDDALAADLTLAEVGSLVDFDNDYADQFAIAAFGEEGAKARLGVPRFSTAGLYVASISMTYYSTADVKLLATYYGCEQPIELATITASDEEAFKTLSVSIPAELLGKDWVEIYIDVTIPSDDALFVMKSFAANPNAPVGNTSSVDRIGNDRSITAGKGTLTVSGFNGENVTVASVNGTVVVNATAAGDNCSYNLEKGVYVVKAGDRKVKVVVK